MDYLCSSFLLSLLVKANSFLPTIESYKRIVDDRSYSKGLGQGRDTVKGSNYGKHVQKGFEEWRSRTVSISTLRSISRDNPCCETAFTHPDSNTLRKHKHHISRVHHEQLHPTLYAFDALHHDIYSILCLVAYWIIELLFSPQKKTVPPFQEFHLRQESELQPRIFRHHETGSSISLEGTLTPEKEIATLGPCYINPSVEIQNGKTPISPRGPSATLHTVRRLRKGLWRSFRHMFKSMGAENEGSSSARVNLTKISVSRLGSTTQGSKRSAVGPGNDDLNGDGEDQRNPKGSQIGSDQIELGQRFACPFRKHDPRKYCVQDWRICALTHHRTVARVKAHLYRYHLIHQCQRCKQVFETENELDLHMLMLTACEIQEGEPVDGITIKTRQQIQSRKKAHPNQTEAEKWQQIYRMIFPNETVPDPYFEPVIDQGENVVPNARDDADRVSNMEGFLRVEVPRIFKSLLQETMQHQAKSHEGDMSTQHLLELIEKAQNQAFKNYRQLTSNTSSNNSSI